MDLAPALRTAFASEYAFLVKAQDAHWNTQGESFYQDHLLFERIYKEVEAAIDPFAENIRKTQAFVPSGFGRMSNLSIVTDLPDDNLPDCEQYKQILLADSDALADLFAAAYDLCERGREFGLANFLADRQDAHRAHSWMLRASLVPEPPEPGQRADN